MRITETGGLRAAFCIALAVGAIASPAHSQTTRPATSTPSVEVAFSPRGGAQALIVRLIDSARSSVRLAAYSFTSADITRALVAAKKRGVDVAVLVDHGHNVEKDSKKAVAALNVLDLAGVWTGTVDAYAIHHDKYIVVDALHVQTGSFNYSSAAELRNSENVLVLWNNPQLAKSYLEHWQSRAAAAKPYKAPL